MSEVREALENMVRIFGSPAELLKIKKSGGDEFKLDALRVAREALEGGGVPKVALGGVPFEVGVYSGGPVLVSGVVSRREEKGRNWPEAGSFSLVLEVLVGDNKEKARLYFSQEWCKRSVEGEELLSDRELGVDFCEDWYCVKELEGLMSGSGVEFGPSVDVILWTQVTAGSWFECLVSGQKGGF